MKTTPDPKNKALLRAEHQRHVRRINDLYIEAQLSVQGLGEILKQVGAMQAKGTKKFKIGAPSTRESPRNIYRDFALVKGLLRDRIDAKEYVQSIVFAVALVESYISLSLQIVLRAYPQKLFTSAKGTEAREGTALPVDLRDVLRAGSIEEIVAERAAQRVRDASYATPEAFFRYCKAILGFDYSDALRSQYTEIKASRDIFVHNDGVVNDIYLGKSGELGRATLGAPLPVDLEYFEATIVCLKKILSETHRGLNQKFGSSDELHRVLRSGGNT